MMNLWKRIMRLKIPNIFLFNLLLKNEGGKKRQKLSLYNKKYKN